MSKGRVGKVKEGKTVGVNEKTKLERSTGKEKVRRSETGGPGVGKRETRRGERDEADEG